MKCLNIRSTNAEIGQKTQLGKLDIHQKKARVYTGDKEPYKLQLHTTQAEVRISSDNFWNSIGVMDWTPFDQKQASVARQRAVAGTERRAREGRELMEAGGRNHKVFSQQSLAYVNTIPDDKTLVVKMPAPSDFTYIPGTVEVNMPYGDPEIRVDAQAPEIQYTPAKVDTYLKEKQNVRMWVTEGKYDIYA